MSDLNLRLLQATSQLPVSSYFDAELYQREVEYELKTLSSKIEPILIISLGIMVLILALGVFLPMWDLGKNMTK